MAFAVLVGGLLAFQAASLVALVVLAGVLDGTDAAGVLEALGAGRAPRAHALLGANAVGQAVGLGLVAWAAARLHTPRAAAFLRLRPARTSDAALAVGGLVAAIPAVEWMSRWGARVPLPTWLREAEAAQEAFLGALLVDEGPLALALKIAAIAAVPAVFEELFFRGALQRFAVRAAGVAGGLVLTALLFSAFHVRASQALPLFAVGLYLGYAVHATGSLYGSMAAHFVYNAVLVVLATFAGAGGELPPLPAWTAGASAAGVAVVLVTLQRRHARAGAHAAAVY